MTVRAVFADFECQNRAFTDYSRFFIGLNYDNLLGLPAVKTQTDFSD